MRLRCTCGAARISGHGGVPRFRVPARRPGNFHLLGQMKVTKAKALNAKPVLAFCARRHCAQRATWKPRCRSHLQFARRGLALRRPWIQRDGRAAAQRSKRPKVQRGRGFARPAPPSEVSDRGAAEFPSGPLGAAPQRAERKARFCIQGLCFGDFHLGPQMKVTRPPGRDPATWRSAKARVEHDLSRRRPESTATSAASIPPAWSSSMARRRPAPPLRR